MTMNSACSPFDLPSCTPPRPLATDRLRRVLVLAPHPDDEAIGCGGLLAQLEALGVPVQVILVSDGSGAGELPEGTVDKRQREFTRALACLGVNIQSEQWQLPDGGLDRVGDLDERIADAIQAFDASLLVAPWPLDLHTDHAAVGRAALACHRQAPLEQGVLFYEVWSPLPATHLLDISHVWSRKEAALNCHETALACGGYARAMSALASYRSLLGPGMAAEGRYAEAYFGLDLLEQAKGIRYRYALAQDGAQVAALFERVFETQAPPGWWAWKYADQPSPGAVALDAQDRPVAFYGAMTRTGRLGEQRVAVCQQADVMVAPEHRFATRRGGVFQTMSRLFLHGQLGEGRRYALAFGFPTPRALRLGIRLGLYRQGDALQMWRCPVQPQSPGLGWSLRLDPAGQLADWNWVDTLTQPPGRQADVFHLQRSADYWARRFGHHPSREYQVMRVTRWGRLRAAVVLQVTPEGLELMDLALADHKAWPALIRACHHAAVKLGCEWLTAWGTQQAITDLPGGEVQEAGAMALPGPALNAPFTEQVTGRCWMLGGDTDFR